MILVSAVLAGFLAGWLRSWLGKTSLQVPVIRLNWLVPVAFLPQLIAFQLPTTRALVSDRWAIIALVGSQSLLFLFAWRNLDQSGFWLLLLGVALNLAVIALNGGLMPISPEMVRQLTPHAPPGSWEIGHRLGTGKDIVLLLSNTRLWQLSDCHLLPLSGPFRVAFSLGDVLIAAGAFWFLWMQGKHPSLNRI